MKKCKSFRLLISRRIDHDLDIAEQRTLDEHVALCEGCRNAMGDYGSLKKLLDEGYEGQFVAAKPASGLKHLFRLPPIQWVARFAVIALVAGSLYIAAPRIMVRKPAGPVSVSIWQESQSMMNSPLGAMVYYENLAGEAINAQFTRIKTRPISSFNRASDSSGPGFSYGSSLFPNDSVLTKRDLLVANW